MSDEKVAGERTVVRNPFIDDPNAGIIVAAGDPIPAGVGVIMNTPNKVDAAANYEEADAADKARNSRPATTVIDAGAGPDREIAERVAANRNTWFESERDFASRASSPDENPRSGDAVSRANAGAPATGDDTRTADDDTRSPGELTVAELDERYGDSEGYPRSGNKAEKVSFAEAV